MATSKSTLINWFKRGLKPLATQFEAWINSYWHKDEAIPMASVDTLVDTLNAIGPDTIAALRDGVPTQGNTLNKLYNLIISVGELVDDHDASTGLPTTGSGEAGAIDKGDYWFITTPGTIVGLGDLAVGDVLFAKVADADESSEFFYLPFASLVLGASQSETDSGTEASKYVAPSTHAGYHRKGRDVTGNDSIVQADQDGIICFNSETAIDFTIDQMIAKTTVGFINIGEGEVTFIAGTGVTIDGLTGLAGGQSHTTAIIFFKSSTNPVIVSGEGVGESTTVLVDGASINLTRSKNSLLTSEAAITFTDNHLGDHLFVEITLDGITASTWTFPSGSLCILDGLPTGNNLITISGAVAGDKIVLGRWNSGTKKYYIATNFGQ